METTGHGGALAAIVRGMAVAMVGSVLGGGLGFAFLVIMGHRLSQPSFGLVVLGVNLVTSGTTLTLAGADYAAIRFVAAAASPGEKRGAMATPVALALGLNCALAAAVFALARPIAVHALGQPHFVQPLRVLALVLPLTVGATMFSAALSGLETARGELVRKVVEQSGRIGFGLLAIGLASGVTGVMFGLAGGAAAALLATGALLALALPRGGRTRLIPVRSVVGFAWPQTVANVSQQCWWLVLLAFISHDAGSRGIALFGAAAAIGRLPALIYNSFSYRFTPTISRLWAEERLDELQSLLHSVTRWVAISAVPLYAVAIALPGPLLRIFGHGFRGGGLALAVVAGGMLVDSLAGPVDRALIMTGNVRLEMLAGLATAIATIPVAFFLTREYGLDGAVWALFAYNVLLNALKTAFVKRRLSMTPLSRELLGPVCAGAAACAITAVIAATTNVAASALGALALAALLVVVYATIELGLVGISPTDRTALRLAIRPNQ